VETRIKKVLVWLSFVVFIALLPLTFAYIGQRMRQPQPFDLNEFLKGGELLLVTAAIAADSMGRLVSGFLFAKPARNMGLGELLFLIANFVLVLMVTFEYSLVKFSGSVDPRSLGSQSVGFFIAALCIGVGVIMLCSRSGE